MGLVAGRSPTPSQGRPVHFRGPGARQQVRAVGGGGGEVQASQGVREVPEAGQPPGGVDVPHRDHVPVAARGRERGPRRACHE